MHTEALPRAVWDWKGLKKSVFKRRFAAVSMNFQNLYDFAQIWQRHSLIHFLSENANKSGGHHVGFQDGADQSSLDYTRTFAQVFSFTSAGWKAMNL